MTVDTVISCGTFKESALFFDSVVPLLFHEEIPAGKIEGNKYLIDLPEEIIPPRLVSKGEYFVDALQNLNLGTLLLPRMSKEEHPDTSKASQELCDYFLWFCSEFDLREAPIICGAPSDNETRAIELVSVALNNVKIINTSELSWDQIFDFRRDDKAVQKLRRFRVFAHDRYEGKSLAYVEDDLSTILDDYEQTLQKHGFQTRNGILTTLINSKMAAGFVGGSFISTLAGKPELAMASLAIGAVVEIGKASLEISRRSHELASLQRNQPISFISYAKTKLNREFDT